MTPTRPIMIAWVVSAISLASVVLSVAGAAIPQNINSMTAAELNQYRDCVRTGMAAGRYLSIAGEHGVPMGLCPHGNMQFLPWHRHHLAAWESALNCTIPYWDWAHDAVPAAFLDESYTDAAGRTWPNPLLVGQQPHGSHRPRSVAIEFPTADLQAGQDLALSRSDLEAFSSSVEDAHNLVHVSIGGDMSDIDYASYDPIFYSHHKNVDRLWFIWQTSPARNPAWASSLTNDYVQTAAGRLSSLQIANDLSAWISAASGSAANATTSSSNGTPSALAGAGTGAAGSNSDLAPGSSTSNSGSPSGMSNSGSSSPMSNSGSNTMSNSGSNTMSNSSSNAMSNSGSSSPMPGGASTPGSTSPGANFAAGSGAVTPDSSSGSSSSSRSGSAAGSSSQQSSSSSSSTTAGDRDFRLSASSAILDDQRRAMAIRMGRGVELLGGRGSDSSSSWASTADGLAAGSSLAGQQAALFRGIRQPSSYAAAGTAARTEHILLKIPNVKSTIQGYRMDVMMVDERIGQVGLLGMGPQTSAAMPQMAYSKDRLVDVSCHLLQNQTNLAQAHDQIRFELYDHDNVLVARPHLNFTLFPETY